MGVGGTSVGVGGTGVGATVAPEVGLGRDVAVGGIGAGVLPR